jgi:hypothetical protein
MTFRLIPRRPIASREGSTPPERSRFSPAIIPENARERDLQYEMAAALIHDVQQSSGKATELSSRE